MFTDYWSTTIQDSNGGKMAIMRPIFKKPYLDSFGLLSWRPISDIGFMSKIVEHLVIRHFNNRVSTHNLLLKYRSAYRPHYSTETTILVVFNDVVQTMDTNMYCGSSITNLYLFIYPSIHPFSFIP